MIFHPLFGARDDGPLARPFRTFSGDAGGELVCYPSGWTASLDTETDAGLAAYSDQQLVDRFDLDPDFFQRHLPAALRRWRESPSQSLIGVLGLIAPSSAPGTQVFADMLAQTRAIGALLLADALTPNMVRSLKRGREYLRVNGTAAVTLDDAGRDQFFRTMLGLLVWERRNRGRCRLGTVKVPTSLFRGLRDRDIRLPKDIPAIEGEPWNLRACRIHLARRSHILHTPLQSVAGTGILSFTATRSIAEYFTGDEGSVVEIGPDAFDVVSSWSLDPELANPDEVTGRQEREWIVRVRPDFTPLPSRLTSRERTFAYSTRDPLGVELLHHEMHAKYKLEGRRVEAFFAYNSNGRGGRVLYRLDDEIAANTRRTTKMKTGFDPMPTPGRSPVDLIYFSQDPWQMKRKKIAHFEITSP
ncbi:MAG: hypothetical protein DI537_17535 [Stutzerimonas stutzeri]|nr:MAG: hypothetical protein DI537_17535 [Stutzerimonas stutzeri]